MKQGTQEWLDFRRQGIGASDASIIMGVNPWRGLFELWKEKVEGTSQEQNPLMKRGQDLEPIARAAFERMTGLCVMPDVKVHPKKKWHYASLDGITFDESIIVEIKCGNKKLHEMAKRKEIPPYYYSQIQHQLSVCELPKAFYFSFDGKDGIAFEVERDQTYIDELLQKEEDFWFNYVVPKVRPKLSEAEMERMDAEEVWNEFVFRKENSCPIN